MTLDDENRIHLINYKVEKANEAYKDACFLKENKKFILAVNRIYYGLFYIISALALKNHFSTKKHNQLIGWFNKNFVKTEIIDKKYSAILFSAYDKRTKGDYEDFVEFSNDEVDFMLKDMKDFIDKLTSIL